MEGIHGTLLTTLEVVKTHEWTGLISPKTFEEVKEVFSSSIELGAGYSSRVQAEKNSSKCIATSNKKLLVT